MPETLTDEQILGLPDTPESEASLEAPETPAAVETPSQETAEQPQLRPESAKDETLAAKQPADKAKPAKDGTPEQPQDIGEVNAAKAAELDRADEAFANSDYQGMAETFESVFGENPSA